MIENLHACVQVWWKILLALTKKYMHLCKWACVKSSTEIVWIKKLFVLFQVPEVDDEDIERTIMDKSKDIKTNKNNPKADEQSKKPLKAKSGKMAKGKQDDKTVSKGENTADNEKGQTSQGEDTADTTKDQTTEGVDSESILSAMKIADEYEFDSSDEEVSGLVEIICKFGKFVPKKSWYF